VQQPNVHTDGFQTYAGPLNLRMWQVTILTNGTCMTVQPHTYYSGPISRFSYERMDCVAQTDDTFALWKDSDGSWWPEYHSEFWLKPNPNHVRADQHSAWADAPSWTGWNPGGSGGNVSGEWINLGDHADYAPASAVGRGYTG
jgi:hypothetical protein